MNVKSQDTTVELYRAKSPRGSCGYLPDETSSLDYRLIATLGTPAYAEMLRRGWRRHGISFFRPACPSCRKCRSLRVDVARFAPSKSQRRTLRRNAGVRLDVRRHPSTDPEQIALFNAYHADMHRRRGWPENETTADDYIESFLLGNWEFSREFRYYEGDRLIGLGLVDELPDALSSVYFYHDPAWRSAGPGTYSVLREIESAQQTGKRWLYLGYWISDCQSMSYKSQYEPHEVLAQYVRDDEEPQWEGAATGSES